MTRRFIIAIRLVSKLASLDDVIACLIVPIKCDTDLHGKASGLTEQVRDDDDWPLHILIIVCGLITVIDYYRNWSQIAANYRSHDSLFHLQKFILNCNVSIVFCRCQKYAEHSIYWNSSLSQRALRASSCSVKRWATCHAWLWCKAHAPPQGRSAAQLSLMINQASGDQCRTYATTSQPASHVSAGPNIARISAS